MSKLLLCLLFAVWLLAASLLASQTVSAATNESIWAQNNLTAASKCMDEMIVHGLKLSRANESFTQARQLYDAQAALEMRGGRANYKLVVQYSTQTCAISTVALKAYDELMVFVDKYNETAQKVDLSPMDNEYRAIMTAYEEERFEDVLNLISSGYEVLDRTEAEQTRLDLVYKATGRSIVSFLKNHWKEILIISAAAAALLVIFWNAMEQAIIRRKIEGLKMRKNSLIQLMKNTQESYFKYKKMSEIEFQIKMNTFKELMRDIDRQFPIYTEQLAKIGGVKKVFK